MPPVRRWTTTGARPPRADDAPGGTAAAGDRRRASAGRGAQRRRARNPRKRRRGDRWLSTKQSFDWTPDAKGQWIQVTFDLVANQVGRATGPAERIAYFLALHDFDDSGQTTGGNVLIDGDPAGGAMVHVDYPGTDANSVGQLGTSKYEPGHNYGVRITNVGRGKFQLEHLYDWVPDEKTVKLTADDLPDGGFGFEFCCGRSFIVDNVVVERGLDDPAAAEQVATAETKRQELAAAVRQGSARLAIARDGLPGRPIVGETAPEVHLLVRGNYGTPGEAVAPAPLAALADANTALDIRQPFDGAKSTGRRLAWARWLTQAGSRQAALVARGANQPHLAASLWGRSGRHQRQPRRQRRGAGRIPNCSITWPAALSLRAGAPRRCTGSSCNRPLIGS